MKENINTIPEAWMQYFNCAKSYYEENGNLKIAQAKHVNGLPLGKWLYLQRVAYKNGELSAVQIELLESLEFVWNRKRVQWENSFREAKAYYDEHGHLYVPSGYSSNGVFLGPWVTAQRVAYKKNCLTQETIDLLNSIGMDWKNDANIIARWETKYAAAKAYYEEHGHLEVKKGYTKGGVTLYSWLSEQKDLQKKGKLSKEKIIKLEKIGIVWRKNIATWEENYALAEKYFKQFGDLLVPLKFTYENSNLGAWIGTQRLEYRQNNLSESKIKKLEEIGMVWNIRTKWEDYYNIAKKYYEEHGNLNICSICEIDGINIGRWISYQRAAYNSGHLPEERYNLLEEINMIWDYREWFWDQNFVLAKEYFEKYGNLHIPKKYEKNGYKIGEWIAFQRANNSKGLLSAARIKKLNEIGMLWRLRDV